MNFDSISAPVRLMGFAVALLVVSLLGFVVGRML